MKQYTKFGEHCDRELFYIHKPSENDGEKGSVKDERIVYVEFKAGLFAALRNYMIRILKTDYNAKITKNPKIQTIGSGEAEAETRVLVDLKLNLEGKDHGVKVRVDNTKYSIEFQGMGTKSETEFLHLKNMTIGKLFAYRNNQK